MKALGIVFLVIGIIVAAMGLSETSDGEFLQALFPQTLLSLKEHHALELYNIALKYQNVIDGGDQKVADNKAAYDEIVHERETLQWAHYGPAGCLGVLGLILLVAAGSRSRDEKETSTYLREMSRIRNIPEVPSPPIIRHSQDEPHTSSNIPVQVRTESSSKSEFEQKLRKLAEWRETGLITATDFDKQKATLLDKFTGGI